MSNVARAARITSFPTGHAASAAALAVGNCRYEPPGTAPAYRPDLSDGYPDIRVVDPGEATARTVGLPQRGNR